MKIFSSAKVNLNLTINREVKEGLHTLSSLMVPISLFDEIHIREIDSGNDIIEFTPQIVTEGDSTIHKSLQLLREVNKFNQYFHITVNKQIPVEAGLGGGSSNAGSIIKFLSTTYDLELPDLSSIARNIGSDVPFFIQGLSANVSGYGERIDPIHLEEPMHLLIATPHERLSTGKVFEEFDREQNHQDSDVVLHNDIEIKNNLLKAALKVEPKLLERKEYLESIMGHEFFMSGSGTTFFCLGEEEHLNAKKQNIDPEQFRLILVTKKIHCSLLQEAD